MRERPALAAASLRATLRALLDRQPNSAGLPLPEGALLHLRIDDVVPGYRVRYQQTALALSGRRMPAGRQYDEVGL